MYKTCFNDQRVQIFFFYFVFFFLQYLDEFLHLYQICVFFLFLFTMKKPIFFFTNIGFKTVLILNNFMSTTTQFDYSDRNAFFPIKIVL